MTSDSRAQHNPRSCLPVLGSDVWAGPAGISPQSKVVSQAWSLTRGLWAPARCLRVRSFWEPNPCACAAGTGVTPGGTWPPPPPQPAAVHRAPCCPQSATSLRAASGRTPPAFRPGRARSGCCGRRRLLLVKGSRDRVGSAWVISLRPLTNTVTGPSLRVAGAYEDGCQGGSL